MIVIHNKCDWQCCCTEKWLWFFFSCFAPQIEQLWSLSLLSAFFPSLAQSVSGPHLGLANNWKAILIFCSGETEGKNTLLFTVNCMEWDTKSARETHWFWASSSVNCFSAVSWAWEWPEGFVVYSGLTMTCCLAGNKLWGDEKWCWQGNNMNKTGGFAWWATVQGGCTSQMSIELNWKNSADVEVFLFEESVLGQGSRCDSPPTLFLII